MGFHFLKDSETADVIKHVCFRIECIYDFESNLCIIWNRIYVSYGIEAMYKVALRDNHELINQLEPI